MSRKVLLALTAAIAVATLAWDLTRSVPGPAASRPRAAPVTAPVAVAPASAGGAPAVPAAARPAVNFLRPAAVSYDTVSPLAREFGRAASYQALYERLRDSAEGETPEGQYFQYRILRACATLAERRTGARFRGANPAQLEERRQLIAASLPEGDPRLAQRLAAFDKATADPCVGLSGLTVTEAELAQLLKGALAGGDPKAKAWQVEREMWQERRSAATPGRAGPTLSDEQLATLREAFSSRDPEAVVIAGRTLASAFRDLTVRVGPDREIVESGPFGDAALLLACEYGYACGENNARVLEACAFQGHCGVASLPDYLFHYGATPHDAQLVDRYRTILRQAADTGNWSAIGFERGNRSPNTPSLTLGGRPIGR